MGSTLSSVPSLLLSMTAHGLPAPSLLGFHCSPSFTVFFISPAEKMPWVMSTTCSGAGCSHRAPETLVLGRICSRCPRKPPGAHPWPGRTRRALIAAPADLRSINPPNQRKDSSVEYQTSEQSLQNLLIRNQRPQRGRAAALVFSFRWRILGEQTLWTIIRKMISSLPNAGVEMHIALTFNERCTIQDHQSTHLVKPTGHKMQAGLCEASYTKGFP